MAERHGRVGCLGQHRGRCGHLPRCELQVKTQTQRTERGQVFAPARIREQAAAARYGVLSVGASDDLAQAPKLVSMALFSLAFLLPCLAARQP